MVFHFWTFCVLMMLIRSATSWFAFYRSCIQGLLALGMQVVKDARDLKASRKVSSSGGKFNMQPLLTKTAQLLRHWSCSPDEIAERRALRRQHRLRKALKKKKPKKSNRFERRKSPPRKGHLTRKVKRSKRRCRGNRNFAGRKKERPSLAKINSVVESLIASWLPCVAYDYATSPKYVPRTAIPEPKSLSKGQPGGSPTFLDTRHSQEASKTHFLSKEILERRASSRETFKKCRWAGKRRIVSRRRTRRRDVSRMRWSPHPSSVVRGGTRSSAHEPTQDLNLIAFSCSLPRFSLTSSFFPLTPKETVGNSKARRSWILLWNWWRELSLVRHVDRSRVQCLVFWSQRKQRPRDSRHGENHAHETHEDLGDNVSQESKLFGSDFEAAQYPASKLPYTRVWAWVGDQLGKGFSSNTSGDGPESGTIAWWRGYHEPDKQCLDEFHGAAIGHQWPKQWWWNLTSHPGNRPGVTLDDYGRVVILKLDFSETGLRSSADGSLYGWSAALGRLDGIVKLHLKSMRLAGPIPRELCCLTRLKELDLSSNLLEGDIPAELSTLTRLEQLNVTENKLTGRIPTELLTLTQLEILLLGRNRLTGSYSSQLWSPTDKDRKMLSQYSGWVPTQLSTLTQLKILSLDASRFSGPVPTELSTLTQLEILSLGGNRLTGGIPWQLSTLIQLKTLDLGRNALTGEIPRQLSTLRDLRELIIEVNELTGPVPRELSTLTQLEILSLGGNRLTGEIPWQLSTLTGLRKLDLGRNELTGLWDKSRNVDPDNVLNADGILPSRLACFLDWLRPFEENLMPNPFHQPPMAIMTKGIEAVKIYFVDLFRDDYIAERRDIKAVIVGEAGSGKTSLRQSIQVRKPSPTKGLEESTVHLDIKPTQLDGITVSLYDCAGQVPYYGLLQKFLTERAVYLVVCDMSKFGPVGKNLAEDQLKLEELGVYTWFRYLSFRVPGCDVILVGTKCDKLRDCVMENAAVRMETACREWLRDWDPTGKKLNIEAGVSMTSCIKRDHLGFRKGLKKGLRRLGCRIAGEKGWPCDRGLDLAGASNKGLLYRLTHKSESDILRGTSMSIPRAWYVALIALEALGKSRDPLRWVLDWLRSGSNMMVQDQQQHEDEDAESAGKHSMLTIGELSNKWQDVARNLPKEWQIQRQILDSALEGALSIREYEGRILRHDSYVFLDVVWLAVILKPILLHQEDVLGNGNISLRIQESSEPIVLSEQQHQLSWKKLKTEGILSEDLASVLWPEGLWKYVLSALTSIDLAFPLAREGTDLVIMLRLPLKRPPAVSEDLRNFREEGHKSLGCTWKMLRGSPPGAIEKVLTRCCRLGATKIFWRFGVMLVGKLTGIVGGKFALLVEYITDELVIEVRGNLKTVGPWMALSYTISAMLSMTRASPGLPWKAWIECPEHNGETLAVSEAARHTGSCLIAGDGCRRCHRETRNLGAFAKEVLSVVDVEKTRDEIYLDVQARFSGSCGHYGISCPEAVRVEPKRLEAMMDTMLTVVKEKEESPVPELAESLQILHGEMRSLKTEVNEKLVTNVNFIIDMMMRYRVERYDTPTFCCVLPQWDFKQDKGISCEDQVPDVWMPRLDVWKEENFKEGKNTFTKEVRLFLVCAYTYRLVPCGAKGQGYKIRVVRERWQKVGRFLLSALQLSCVTVGAGVAAGIPSTVLGEAAKASLGLAEEATMSKLGNLKQHLAADKQSIMSKRTRDISSAHVPELMEKEYDALRSFLHDVELTERIKKMKADGISTKCDDLDFVFFADVMEQVQEQESRGSVQWVLREYAEDWREARRQEAARNCSSASSSDLKY